MNDDFLKTATGEEDKITHGILETEDGDLYLRLTQIPTTPGHANQEQKTWATVSVEYWDFKEKSWTIDNMLQNAMSRNQFTVFEDEKDFHEFWKAAQQQHALSYPSTDSDMPKGTQGQT